MRNLTCQYGEPYPLNPDFHRDRLSDIYADRVTARHKPDGALWAPAVGSAMFEGFCRMFFTVYCPLTVEGLHHLPKEPFLLCSNHSSHADSAALMTASGRSFRSFALLGASDYFFHSRNVRWKVAPWLNVIPIERRPGPRSLSTSLTICRRFMEQTGGSLILYPEGTRSIDGSMQDFKAGAGLFATQLGVPLVPAYIDGTHRMLPKGRTMPRSGAVTVRFGEAMSMAKTSTNGELLRDRRRTVVDQLHRNILNLSMGASTQELVAQIQEKG
jgi:1-acyl-sn-glycerol-3-phosphate acyltransferase